MNKSAKSKTQTSYRFRFLLMQFCLARHSTSCILSPWILVSRSYPFPRLSNVRLHLRMKSLISASKWTPGLDWFLLSYLSYRSVLDFVIRLQCRFLEWDSDVGWPSFPDVLDRFLVVVFFKSSSIWSMLSTPSVSGLLSIFGHVCWWDFYCVHAKSFDSYQIVSPFWDNWSGSIPMSSAWHLASGSYWHSYHFREGSSPRTFRRT